MNDKYDDNTMKSNIAVMRSKLDRIELDVRDIKKTIKTDYVTRTEFDPIKRLVYGMVGIILVAVVTAIVSLVLVK